MTKLRGITALVVCSGLFWAAPARADVVSDWNAVILQYVGGNAAAVPPIPTGRGGPPGLFDIALAHLAMHDAVQAIEGTYQPYHYSTPGAGSLEAAVAAAAHRVLVLLYPSQQGSLDTLYNNYLTSHSISTTDPGLAVGEAAAVALHSNHYRPVIVVPDFFGGTGPGEWRHVLPNGSLAPLAFLYMAFSTPFTLNRVSQFRPPPPPPMKSMVYVREYDEVKALGDSAAQSAAQLTVGRFWSGNFVAQWNEALQRIANANVNNVGDSARLFALANTAAADSAMAVWESKYFYNFWRPSTAIQLGADDGNPRTAPQAGWTPFLANPAYPDYVSGANGLTGAFTGMLEEFFGSDQMEFSVKSIPAQAANPERFFTSFSQAALEVVDARILLGIHFRSADVEAKRLGNRVAHWVFQKFLRPVPGSR
jgi:hypothetical protein